MANLSGGDLFDDVLRRIDDQPEAPMVRIGFFDSATYPNGELVAAVAFWNEYGTETSPARPFFRHMIADKKAGWSLSFGRLAKLHDFDIKKCVSLMGEGISDQLRSSIVEFDDPPNAESTIARKGFATPLQDTNVMLRSVGYELDESS